MKALTLQSGSAGNCTYVVSRGCGLFIDAGISWKRAQTRLKNHGLSSARVSGIFVSHEHTDHTCGLSAFLRSTAAPLITTERTYQALCERGLKRLTRADVQFIKPGKPFQCDHFRVTAHRISHDAVDPVGFVVDDGNWRLGVLSDLGRISRCLRQEVANLDGLFLESNFDQDLLRANRQYPEELKQRIRGGRGHLENRVSAAFAKHWSTSRLRHIVLTHLSEDNNTPELALKAHRALWESELPLWPAPQICVAPRFDVSPLIEFDGPESDSLPSRHSTDLRP